MTLTLTDVLQALPSDPATKLLDQAVNEVLALERLALAQAEQAKREHQQFFDQVTAACRHLLPLELRSHVVHGWPEGWHTPPMPHGGVYWLELHLPGMAAGLRVRFTGHRNKARVDWKLEDYLLPGLATVHQHHGRTKPALTWAEGSTATAKTQTEALANLVETERQYRDALEQYTQEDRDAYTVADHPV